MISYHLSINKKLICFLTYSLFITSIYNENNNNTNNNTNNNMNNNMNRIQNILEDENIICIIKKWLDKIIENSDYSSLSQKKAVNIIDLSTFTIIELLNLLNLYLYKNDNNINTNITTIINGNKTIIQVHNPILLTLFYKKQLNSNWTYLYDIKNYKYNSELYQLKCNLDIHLHQSKSKSYIVSSKKKKVSSSQSKTKKSMYKNEQKNKQLDFNQFFDYESD